MISTSIGAARHACSQMTHHCNLSESLGDVNYQKSIMEKKERMGNHSLSHSEKCHRIGRVQGRVIQANCECVTNGGFQSCEKNWHSYTIYQNTGNTLRNEGFDGKVTCQSLCGKIMSVQVVRWSREESVHFDKLFQCGKRQKHDELIHE